MINSYGRIFFIFLFAIATSALFCFFIYPALNQARFPLDIDNHGLLGFGLYHHGTFSYFPDKESTINRGPFYPLVIAFTLFFSDRWYPGVVQLAQCLLFAGTCVLVFWIVQTLWSTKLAFFASLVCAVHPYLIWFTSRIYVEVIATFLFTAIVAASLSFSLKPNYLRGMVLGALLGMASLTKTTFLPFVVIVPLFFMFQKSLINRIASRMLQSFFILICALIIVVPWSVRNWNLTHHFIPVQGLLGYNLQIGDGYYEHFGFSIDDLWLVSYQANLQPLEASVNEEIPPGTSLWEKELELDRISKNKSIQKYIDQPSFLIKKMLFDTWAFWFLAPTHIKRMYLLIALEGPLLILFILKSIQVFFGKSAPPIQYLHISLVWLYFAFHLPILAESRYSVVLIPTMIAYSASLFSSFCPPPSR